MEILDQKSTRISAAAPYWNVVLTKRKRLLNASRSYGIKAVMGNT